MLLNFPWFCSFQANLTYERMRPPPPAPHPCLLKLVGFCWEGFVEPEIPMQDESWGWQWDFVSLSWGFQVVDGLSWARFTGKGFDIHVLRRRRCSKGATSPVPLPCSQMDTAFFALYPFLLPVARSNCP